jgi:hypothetical protein
MQEARSFINRTLQKTRSDAKCRRNLEFTIDTDYVMDLLEQQNGVCALSGWTLEFERGGTYKGNKNPKGCTVDRIDNAKGYIKGNIQLTCTLPNYLKSDMDIAQFRSLCKAIGERG